MTKVIDIYNYIDSFAPFDTSADFDNTGILVGDSDAEVTMAIVTLDITKEVVEESAELGAQLIVSHHPVIFNPLKRLTDDSVPALMIKNNLAAICAHTNLDLSEVFGVNTCLAAACGLSNCVFDKNSESLFMANTKRSLTAMQLAEQIKAGLGCENFAFTRVNNDIKKVGLCSGAGGDEIFTAASNGCDAFITGEIKHHEIIAANDSGVSVFCVGHYKSEDIVIKPLAEKLADRFADVKFMKSKVFTDRVEFL